MNKQTAVEWLVHVVQSNIAPNYIPKEIVEKAKEMEKQQIIDASNNSYLNSELLRKAVENKNTIGKQYYQETFKNK